MPQTKDEEFIPGITVERVKDLLCCALEGGSNYWYWIDRFNYPGEKVTPLKFPHLDLPFLDGGSLSISDREHIEKGEFTLDRTAMKKGLELLQEKYPKHWADFITENDDAITGDVFLQCALFGEVVFS